MPGEEQISYQDLFNLTNNSDLKEAIALIRELNKEYQDLAKNFTKQEGHISNAIKDISDETRKYVKDSEDLAKSQKQSGEALKENTTYIDQAYKGINDLVKAQDNAKKMSDIYGRSVDALNAQLKAQVKQFNQIDTSTEQGRADAEKYGKQIRDLRKEIKDMTDVTRKQNNVFERTETSYDALVKRNNELRASLRALPGSFDKTNKKAEELRKEIRDNTAQLKEWDKAIGDNFRNVGNYEGALDGLLGKFEGLAGGGGGGIGSVISGLGGMVPQLAIAGAAIGAVGAGIDAINDLAKELQPQLKLVGDLLGEVGDQAEKTTARVRGLEDTFDTDFNDVVRTANTLVDTFGIESGKALDIIEQGFIQGADASGELLDSLKEYSVQFKDAGLGAEDLLAVINASTEQGIFSDKGVDAVKEFGLRIREMTVATKAALVPLGKVRNEQIQMAVDAGDTGKALQLVTAGMKEVDLSAQQLQTIIADVFGGPGEDVGQQFLMNLGDILAATDEGTVKLTKLQRQQLETLRANQEFEESLTKLGARFVDLSVEGGNFWTRLKTFGIDTLLSIMDVFQPVADAFKDLFGALRDAAERLGLLNKEAGKSNIIFKAIKINFQILVFIISNFVKAFTWVVEKFDEFIIQSKPVQTSIKAIGDAWDWLTDKISYVPRVLSGLSEAINEFFSGFIRTAKAQGQVIADFFKALVDPDTYFDGDPGKIFGDIFARGIRNSAAFGNDIKEAFLRGFNRSEIEKEAEATFKVLGEDRIAKDPAAKGAGKAKKVTKEALVDMLKYWQDYYKTLADLDNKRLARFKLAIRERMDANQTAANEEILTWQKTFNAGLISEEDFNNIRASIEDRYRKKSLEDERAALNNIIDLNMVKGAELIAIKKRISEIDLALNEKTTSGISQKWKENFAKVADYVSQGFQNVIGFFSQLTQNQIQNTEFALEQLEDARKRDVELAGNNQAQIDKINADAEAKRIKLEAQARQDKIRQARLDKATALLSAIVNTAKAVVQFGVITPPAILAGILGGIQIATIAATPIPQFYKGTKSSPEGFAEIAERGSELVVTPEGKLQYADKRQVAYLKEGSQVIDHDKTKMIEELLVGPGKLSDNPNSLYRLEQLNEDNSRRLAGLLEKGNKEIIKAISKMERFSLVGTRRGMEAWVENEQGKQELLNNRYG